MNHGKAEKKITSWLRTKLRKSGTEGFVFGLSGGVDSSTLAVLVRKAVGNRHLALHMPIGEKEDRDVRPFCKNFKINLKVVDLTDVYKKLLKLLPGADRRTKGNLKARLRMITLYYFANKKKYLVLGTGNKSELLQNYFTKYGDGGVDLLPLGDLYKTRVIELAKYLEIPDVISNKEPSAGLWKSQTDEKELGIEYKKLDIILYKLFDKKLQPKEVAKELGVPLNKVKEIVNRYQKGKHKLLSPPVARVYTSKSK